MTAHDRRKGKTGPEQVMGTAQLIAIDANALDRVLSRIDDLERKLDAVQMTPPKEWLSIGEYAAQVNRSESTINRWIAAGSVESKMVGRVRMVRA